MSMIDRDGKIKRRRDEAFNESVIGALSRPAKRRGTLRNGTTTGVLQQMPNDMKSHKATSTDNVHGGQKDSDDAGKVMSRVVAERFTAPAREEKSNL